MNYHWGVNFPIDNSDVLNVALNIEHFNYEYMFYVFIMKKSVIISLLHKINTENFISKNAIIIVFAIIGC